MASQLNDPYFYGKGGSKISDWLLWSVISVSMGAFLVWVFSGCYSPKKAEKQIAKANYKHPAVVAKKARELYPCITTRTERIIDSTAYNIWKDSVGKTEAFYRALLESVEPETVRAIDTVVDEKKVARLLSDNEKLKGAIRQLNYMLSNAPPIYIKEKKLIEDSAKMLLVYGQMSEQQKAFEKSMSDSSALLSSQRAKIQKLERKSKAKSKIILGLSIGLFALIALLIFALRRRI